MSSKSKKSTTAQPVVVSVPTEVVEPVSTETVEIPNEFINFVVQHRQCSIEEAYSLITKLVSTKKSESKPNQNRGKFTKLTESNNPHFAHWLKPGKIKCKGQLYRLVSANFYEGYPETTLYLKLRNEDNAINCISYKSCELILEPEQLDLGL